ncbi:MAG: Ca2+-dependent phosphoinositide-specific phospholipase C [Proteobacteria bacterium]|nr:Ca2+-dependent phosphoinositide-specific phospholipase C [Pseudomonadota bacterium]
MRNPGLPEYCACLAGILLSISLHAHADEIRLNQIQVVGSHNSYKLAMDAQHFAALSADNPATAASLEYWHIPLADQLDLGLRKLEIDVFYDPQGALFGRNRAQAGHASDFAVLHVQNLDERSVCINLVACLQNLRTWSDANPRHAPVFVSFNAKDQAIEREGFLRPLQFDDQAWVNIDAEIRSVLGDRLLTPEDVFDNGALTWPLLDETRGRFVMILDEGGDKRAAYANNWMSRAMFANFAAEHPGAAIMIINDPIIDFEHIRSMVERGYIVRTRADADTLEARSGQTKRRDQAFASGAQLISTDYYLPATHFGTDYVVGIPTSICNRHIIKRCGQVEP